MGVLLDEFTMFFSFPIAFGEFGQINPPNALVACKDWPVQAG